MEHPATGDGVSATVRRNPSTGRVEVNGRILGLGATPMTIHWIAAAPTTRGIGFAGSGQPYPNREIAFAGTPHRGKLESGDGSFQLKLKGIPAGYFSGLGSVYVPPSIDFVCVSKSGEFKTTLQINETAAPYRWISGAPAPMRPDIDRPDSTGRSMYYFGREQLPLFNNQEAQLRAKAYPGDMTARGWPEADDVKPWTSVPPPA